MTPMFDGGPEIAPGGAAAAQAGAAPALDPNDISDSIVPYATHRLLFNYYFWLEPYLSIWDGDDPLVNVHPMWKTNESHRREVCGYYFLPWRDPEECGVWWNGCVDHNAEARENEVPNMLLYTLRRHEYRPRDAEDCGTVRNVTEWIEDALSPVLNISYETCDLRTSVWENDNGRDWFSYITTRMRAKGLGQGGEGVAATIRRLDINHALDTFQWPPEVDFVWMPEEENFQRSIRIKPSALARYITDGGELW